MTRIPASLLAAPAALVLSALVSLPAFSAGNLPGAVPTSLPVAASSPTAALLFKGLAATRLPRELTPSQSASWEQVLRHQRAGQGDQALAAWSRFADDYFTADREREINTVVHHLVYQLALQDNALLTETADRARFHSTQFSSLRAYRSHLEQLRAAARAGELPEVQTLGFPAEWHLDAAPTQPGARRTMNAQALDEELQRLRARYDQAGDAASAANAALQAMVAPKQTWFDQLSADTTIMITEALASVRGN